jgi:hypothetical protein
MISAGYCIRQCEGGVSGLFCNVLQVGTDSSGGGASAWLPVWCCCCCCCWSARRPPPGGGGGGQDNEGSWKGSLSCVVQL